ncbi:pirin family protein [Candidatus Latescibacterota bacterium]
MDSFREVNEVLSSIPTIEGAGVHLKRVFGNKQMHRLDPFLLLDDFHSDNPEYYEKGFPWHPHRGIETITYVLNGNIEHGDSMGNSGIISSGDVQWMTSGSGIIHQEMPAGEESGLLWGFQLWSNLPAAQKMMEPRYREIKSHDIPEVTTDTGAKIKIICGEVLGVKGPVRDIVIEPEYLDITVPPETMFTYSVTEGHTVFAYIIDGSGDFNAGHDSRAVTGPENLVIFGDGIEIAVSSGSAGVRFLLVSGKPIKEPIAWYGPIVMNTNAELKQAFEEYEAGTFIKHR